MRVHEGGVEVDHHPPVLDRRPREVPHPFPRRRPRARDRRERGIDVLGQGRDQPGHRRVRGHPAEHRRLGAQHRHVAGGVAAERDRDREIQHDLARVVRGQRPPPRPEPGGELLGQPAAPGRLDQQRAAGVRHQRLAASDHGQPGTTMSILHPRSASRFGSVRVSTTTIKPR
jgi:hypothetical protein